MCTPDSRIVQLNLTNNSTGRLSSPDYPLQFPSVSACYWRLKAPTGYRIKLRFTTLNIQGNCKENINGTEWIRVDDHFTTDFSSVASYWGTYCGGVQPPVIYSTRNELQVFFTSSYTGGKDDKSAKQPQQSTDIGFYAIYEVTTQGNNLLITMHRSHCKLRTKRDKQGKALNRDTQRFIAVDICLEGLNRLGNSDLAI